MARRESTPGLGRIKIETAELLLTLCDLRIAKLSKSIYLFKLFGFILLALWLNKSFFQLAIHSPGQKISRRNLAPCPQVVLESAKCFLKSLPKPAIGAARLLKPYGQENHAPLPTVWSSARRGGAPGGRFPGGLVAKSLRSHFRSSPENPDVPPAQRPRVAGIDQIDCYPRLHTPGKRWKTQSQRIRAKSGRKAVSMTG